MQFLRVQVAIIGEHVEVNVHGFLPSVGYAENVDGPRSDGQVFRQEVPERLEAALPLHTRLDKIPGCDAFRWTKG